uniref:Uncharacterized protein n=1 Tax=Setaria italica TaxID=4555 RepID=K4A438_SETIT
MVCTRWSNPMVGRHSILGHWWPCIDNSYNSFPSSSLYALRGLFNSIFHMLYSL